MAQPVLEFRDVVKRFGTVPAVDGVSFSIQPGEIFTLLGHRAAAKQRLSGLWRDWKSRMTVRFWSTVHRSPRHAAASSLRRTSGRWEWFSNLRPSDRT